MNLNFEALEKALLSYENSIESLKKAKTYPTTDLAMLNTLKAGIIQNFEFTYELCWKFIKRWLSENISKTETEGITRRHLYRMAAKHKLIDDVEKWMIFHEARNETSHTYDKAIAEEVYYKALEFIAEAKKTYENLVKNND
ncbi:MAG: nucleotidyltransferase substrate binding protein [Candidatus Muiribacteriota bacterium]|jgi:nucleotidyltransferase substrate binding protein (TIGR01987 family)